jgi:methylmalonyl-CoA mutase cobalamin-binding subunit
MKKRVLISIEDSHMDRVPAVVEALKSEGLEVNRAMPALGVVSGTAEEDKFSSLREVAGVTSLEEEQGFQIAPPDSPVQ